MQGEGAVIFARYRLIRDDGRELIYGPSVGAWLMNIGGTLAGVCAGGIGTMVWVFAEFPASIVAYCFWFVAVVFVLFGLFELTKGLRLIVDATRREIRYSYRIGWHRRTRTYPADTIKYVAVGESTTIGKQPKPYYEAWVEFHDSKPPRLDLNQSRKLEPVANMAAAIAERLDLPLETAQTESNRLQQALAAGPTSACGTND